MPAPGLTSLHWAEGVDGTGFDSSADSVAAEWGSTDDPKLDAVSDRDFVERLYTRRGADGDHLSRRRRRSSVGEPNRSLITLPDAWSTEVDHAKSAITLPPRWVRVVQHHPIYNLLGVKGGPLAYSKDYKRISHPCSPRRPADWGWRRWRDVRGMSSYR